ncbi:hypothetical protein KVH22_25490 [Streptomyces olivaceus]|uniref:hypothetical protein n=1 Tax=Streptomyces olivaceus TaxID=47716 RepID=UPI001CCB55B7|nr:hypothetical protein [Streptomyces olivaceus]MBZ6258873.1 hypothetical protein [Streptomyces olivaceus]
MAQDSWPSPDHNDRAVNDAEYEKIAARFSDDGIYGTPTNPAVVAAGIGLTVTVRADVAASVRGHAWYSGSSTVTLDVDPNTSGQTRVDRIVLRLDRSTWTVRAVVLKGVPGAGAPMLTQGVGVTGVYEVPVARVTVLNGAAAVSVAREELYVGTRCRPCTSGTRNPNPEIGELCYETNTGRTMQWSGSSWQTVFSRTDSTVVDSPLSAWPVLIESTIEERSGSVHLRLGAWQRKGALGYNTDSRLPVMIPAQYRHPYRAQYVTAYCSGTEVARITIYAANTDKPGQVWLTHKTNLANNDYVWGASVSWGI